MGAEYINMPFSAFGLAVLVVSWALVHYGPAAIRWILLKMYDLFLRNKNLQS